MNSTTPLKAWDCRKNYQETAESQTLADLLVQFSSRQGLVMALLSIVAIPRLGLHCLSQYPSSQKPKHSHPAEALPCLFFIPGSCLIAPRLTCQPSPSLAMLKLCLHVLCVLIRFQKHRQVFEHISCVSVLAQAFSITFPQSEELLHNMEDSYSPGLYICNPHQRDHGRSISRPH